MKVRVFPKSANKQNEMCAYHLQYNFLLLFLADERLETEKFSKWQRNFRSFVPNGKRELPLDVVYNFRTDFSGKLLFLLTFNRNFRIFSLNGKHPLSRR